MEKFKTLNIKTTTTNTHCAATMRYYTCETVCADPIFFMVHQDITDVIPKYAL